MHLTSKFINHKIRPCRKDTVVLISKLILDLLPDCKIYLFGSYAKRCIRESSDVDILILDKSINKDNKKDIRIKLRGYIDEKTNYKYEFDLKLYNIEEFMQFKDIPLSFEQSINEYMIGVIN